MATAASIATTAPIRCSVRLVVTPRIADGSKRRNESSRWRSGHSTAIMTAPSAISLNTPLVKFATACLPKTRLKPAPGDTLLNFGLRDSPDHTSRCWIMLPAIAAIISINSGTPTAASTAMPSVLPSCSSAAPSVRSMPALATRSRSGIRMPPPIEPEKVDSTSVAPAIMNQVLTSWLLATSPRSSASSRRFCVGSSVFSAASCSSAIASAPRNQLVHDADEVVHVSAHHARQHRGEDQKACQDRERHPDEIDLHLRHQARQHAQPHVEDQAKHQKRRRQLRA